MTFSFFGPFGVCVPYDMFAIYEFHNHPRLLLLGILRYSEPHPRTTLNLGVVQWVLEVVNPMNQFPSYFYDMAHTSMKNQLV